MTVKEKLGFFLILVVVIICFFFVHMLDAGKDDREKWKTSPTGIKYYHECVDNQKFIVTKSSREYLQLTGPIARCGNPKINLDNKIQKNYY